MTSDRWHQTEAGRMGKVKAVYLVTSRPYVVRKKSIKCARTLIARRLPSNQTRPLSRRPDMAPSAQQACRQDVCENSHHHRQLAQLSEQPLDTDHGDTEARNSWDTTTEQQIKTIISYLFLVSRGTFTVSFNINFKKFAQLLVSGSNYRLTLLFLHTLYRFLLPSLYFNFCFFTNLSVASSDFIVFHRARYHQAVDLIIFSRYAQRVFETFQTSYKTDKQVTPSNKKYQTKQCRVLPVDTRGWGDCG